MDIAVSRFLSDKAPAASAPQARETTRPPRMVVRIIEDPAALEEHVGAWDDLAAAAIEPNALYESWALRPALRTLGADHDFVFALVYRASAPPEAPQLCGFFPLARRRHYKGLPVSVLSPWTYMHLPSCTPLLRAGEAQEALGAFLEWAGRDSRGAPLVEFPYAAADGPFQRALVDCLNERAALRQVPEIFNRALLARGESAEAALSEGISNASRKELRRLRKRLSEMGRLESRVLRQQDNFDRWFDDFLALEASGWKGRDGTGTALALHVGESAFFREASRGAHERGRLQMSGLFLDERPVAMVVTWLAGNGGYCFKISYDEALARYSPGVQLILDLTRHVHDQTRLQWIDSCAVPGHSMIDRLWPARRMMQTIVMSTGRWHGDLAVSAWPLFRWLKRLCLGRAGIRPAGAI